MTSATPSATTAAASKGLTSPLDGHELTHDQYAEKNPEQGNGWEYEPRPRRKQAPHIRRRDKHQEPADGNRQTRKDVSRHSSLSGQSSNLTLQLDPLADRAGNGIQDA